MPVMKATKKPVAVEAVQWTGDNFDEVECFIKSAYSYGKVLKFDNDIRVRHPDDTTFLCCDKGGYIIKDENDHFSSCKPDTFKATYDVVQDLIDIPLDPTINPYALVTNLNTNQAITGSAPNDRSLSQNRLDQLGTCSTQVAEQMLKDA